MIKGHTKIELTNVRTGERQVVEDDNLVTNILDKYFELSPLTNNYPKFNPNPMVDTFFGGLLLFQNPIEEKVDNYDLPSDNPMIGNGIVNYSSLDVPGLGAYNKDESKFSIENGIVTRKYVYDFGTSKGNGTISTVCLTNPFMGYVGAGNRSGKYEQNSLSTVPSFSSFNANPYMNSFGENGSVWSGDLEKIADSSMMCLTMELTKNCGYYVPIDAVFYNSGNPSIHFKAGFLEIYKAHFPFTKMNPMCPLFGYRTIYEKVKIQAPEVFQTINRPLVSVTCCADAIYFIVGETYNSYYISNNATFHVWKLSNDFKTSEVFTLKNTTGKTISIGGYNVFPFVDDMFWIGSNPIYKFNLKSPANIVEIPFMGAAGERELYSLNAVGKSIFAYAKKTSSSYVAYRVETAENKIYVLNGNPRLVDSVDGGTFFNMLSDKDYILSTRDYRYNTSISLVRNPFTLSTINNLPEPVTKTSDMTMKITYTITSKIEPDEEE